MIKWAVKQGWGYVVVVEDKDGKEIDRYSAGDCFHDSTTFGTGDISGTDLEDIAAYSAGLLKEQHELECDVIEDQSILPE